MKKVKTIIITIIVSAITSACWEWAFRPLFLFIYDRIIVHSLHLYSDSFYSSIPRSLTAPSFNTYFMLMMIIVVLITFPPEFLKLFFHEVPKEKSAHTLKRIYQLVLMIVIFYSAFSKSTAYRIARDTLADIEIVAPYVSDMEYKTLKSDFYRIDSKADYLILAEQIEQIMADNNLTE